METSSSLWLYHFVERRFECGKWWHAMAWLSGSIRAQVGSGRDPIRIHLCNNHQSSKNGLTPLQPCCVAERTKQPMLKASDFQITRVSVSFTLICLYIVCTRIRPPHASGSRSRPHSALVMTSHSLEGKEIPGECEHDAAWICSGPRRSTARG